jgi:hypothetical protein
MMRSHVFRRPLLFAEQMAGYAGVVSRITLKLAVRRPESAVRAAPGANKNRPFKMLPLSTVQRAVNVPCPTRDAARAVLQSCSMQDWPMLDLWSPEEGYSRN